MAHPPKSFWHYIGHALPVIVLIAGIMLLMAHSGILYHWEMYGLDPLLRADSFKDPDVRIVEITDDDYARFFEETSPLRRDVLKKLILTLAAAKPKILVIDLDVTPTRAETEKSATPLPMQVQEANPAQVIIWPQMTERVVGRSAAELQVSPLLKSIESSRLGVPLFPRERDGLIRAYQHFIPVVVAGSKRFWPSLPWQAFRGGTVLDTPRHDDEEDETRYFNFSGDRYAFDHSDVASILPRFSPANPPVNFEGKTLILGGNYAAARDEYFTPIGPVAGVDLVADAMETEIRGGGMRHLQEVAVFFVDVMLGMIIAAVAYESKSFWRTLVLSISLGVILPILASYLVFHSWGLWLSFVPVMLGATLHIAWDQVKEQRQAVKEQKEKIDKLEAELSGLKKRARAKAAGGAV